MIIAFKRVFNERLPLKLQTDVGSEFTNKKFHTFLRGRRVEHFITHSELKSSVVGVYSDDEKCVLAFFHSESDPSLRGLVTRYYC